MNAKERRAFYFEIYGPEPTFTAREIQDRSERSRIAREMAQRWGLPQRVIDRAASFANDGGSPEAAVRAAVERDEHCEELKLYLPAEPSRWVTWPNGELLTADEI